MRNKLFTVSLSLLFIFLMLQGQAQPSTKKIDTYWEKARVDWGVTGMSLAIVKDGKPYHLQGYGYLKEGEKAAVTPSSLFAIASNTKAFISATLAKLVSENKIQWNDKVVQYLPYFSLYDTYTTQETTIKDLLSHRVGLGTFSGDFIWYKSEFTAEEVLRRAKYLPKSFEFRNGYGYSNLMYLAAGEVIKSVSGLTWDAYIRQYFFEPLNMNQTITSTNELISKKNVASPHKIQNGKNMPIEWTNWDNMGAAGGIISTAEDMAKWMLFLLNQGITNRDTLINPTLLREVWTPLQSFTISSGAQAFIPERNFNGYGMGWGLFDYKGLKVMTHSGGYDGMYSRVVVVPQLNLGFALLTNGMTGIINPVIYQVIDDFVGSQKTDWSAKYLSQSGGESVEQLGEKKMKERKVNTKPTFDKSKLVGQYMDPVYDTLIVREENGQLLLEFPHAPKLNATLSHWHYDVWKINWNETHAWFDFGTIQFQSDHSHQITGFTFDVPNYDIFFHEMNPKKVN